MFDYFFRNIGNSGQDNYVHGGFTYNNSSSQPQHGLNDINTNNGVIFWSGRHRKTNWLKTGGNGLQTKPHVLAWGQEDRRHHKKGKTYHIENRWQWNGQSHPEGYRNRYISTVITAKYLWKYDYPIYYSINVIIEVKGTTATPGMKWTIVNIQGRYETEVGRFSRGLSKALHNTGQMFYRPFPEPQWIPRPTASRSKK